MTLTALKKQCVFTTDIEVEHIIPENRTTIEYIKRLSGNGVSERMRT